MTAPLRPEENYHLRPPPGADVYDFRVHKTRSARPDAPGRLRTIQAKSFRTRILRCAVQDSQGILGAYMTHSPRKYKGTTLTSIWANCQNPILPCKRESITLRCIHLAGGFLYPNLIWGLLHATHGDEVLAKVLHHLPMQYFGTSLHW